MRTPRELFDDLQALGAKLSVAAGDLRIKAPKGVFTTELRDEVRHHKPALLQLLGASSSDIPRLSDRDGYALSHAQRRVWIASQFEGASRAYNVAIGVQLEGMLDRGALERAFDALIQRHEILRTSFDETATGVLQRVFPKVPFRLEYFEISAGPEIDAVRNGQLLAEQVFDLRYAPLMRARLVRLSAGCHALFVVMHHIVTDGWSLSLALRELGDFYNAFRRGTGPVVTDLPIQYRDFAAWQNGFLTEIQASAQRDYWRQKLTPLAPPLALPTDFSRPAVRGFEGQLVTLRLASELRTGLTSLGVAASASLFMVLCALVKVLLARHAGWGTIVVGTPTAGRSRPELERQLGFYLNALVLRDEVSADMSFFDLLRNVKQTAIEAYEHDIWPFDEIVSSLGAGSDPSHSPLYDVQISLQNAGTLELKLDGLKAIAIDVPVSGSKHDLSLDFVPEGSELLVGIRFNSEVFARDRIVRMGGHLTELAKSIIADPYNACGRLNMLPAAERELVVGAWHGPAIDVSDFDMVPDIIRRQAERTPGAIAVRFADEALTYQELEQRSNQFANHLLASASEYADEPIAAVFLERSNDMLVSLLGTLKAGYAYLPLDPVTPDQRCIRMLRNAGVAVVITQQSLAGRASTLCAQARIGTPPIIVDRQRERIALASASALARRLLPDQRAYLIYTSGSTGEPKGVEVTHGGFTNFLTAMRRAFGLGSNDAALAITTISFDISGLELFLPLICGGTTLVVASSVASDGARLAEQLADEAISVVQGTPSTWRMLIAAGWKGNPSLTALCGGEPLSRELAVALRQRTKELWNLYGPTETSVWTTAGPLADSVQVSTQPIGLGKPIDNTSLYILDGMLHPSPIGVWGEFYIGGKGVGRGYRSQRGLTAERFVADPFQRGRRMYRTGDIGRLCHDGSIEFLGRVDLQVKIRGHRIEIAEVEAALISHPKVANAAVKCVTNDHGEGILAGYYVPDAAVDRSELRDHLGRILPPYMVPTVFVEMDALPISSSGKVNRAALPPPDSSSRVVEYEAPRDELEAALARMWESVLQVGKVGIADSFFDLGGHSLQATRVLFRLREELGTRVTMIDIFRNPTIGGLAALIRARSTEAGAPLEVGSPIAAMVPAASLTPEELEWLRADNQ
jgi:amino acid adenylation domain-containing protein